MEERPFLNISYLSVSALVDSPRSGEKHTNFYPADSCEYDTDSPSCYDSDSLLDFTTSSYLESIDTLDTSVSWYCRGDEDEGDVVYSRHGDGDEDNEIHFALRSGERTPLSPNALDSPAPLLDSKVFILRPVRLLNDDFDFTCAGSEEASSLGVRVRYQLHHPHHHHHHHHHHIHHPRRHNNKNNSNTNHALRPHPRKPEHQQPQHPTILPSDSDSNSNVISPQSNLSKLQSSIIDYSKRRWSAPSASSPHSSMLTRATTMTGTLLDTPLSLSYPESSSISQDQDQDLSITDSNNSSDSPNVNSSQPPREKNRPCSSKSGGGLQMYTITDAQNQILTSKLKALQISSFIDQPMQRKTSSSSINGMDTPTPRTWPNHRRRKSEAFYRLRSELLGVSNIGFEDTDTVSNYRQENVDVPTKKRSQTMQLFCASNKWGNQPPNGYI